MGFWKFGTAYSSFARVVFNTSSSASTSMPPSSVGTCTYRGRYGWKDCSAPRYVGASTSTTSPSSIRTLPSRSRPCWLPVTICTFRAGMPACAPIHSRSGACPSVVEYCSAAGPYTSSTRLLAARTSSSGNSSGAGRPPAKLITSGCCVTFRISRMALAVMLCARRDSVPSRSKASGAGEGVVMPAW